MTHIPDDYSEDNLAEQIQGDLDAYFQSRGFISYSTRPSGTRQGFEDLDQFCGDLITASERFGALILEVKVRKPETKFGPLGSLPRYKEDQHAGLKILEGANVPVYFAYDEGTDFSAADLDQNLKQIRSPLPSELDIARADDGHVLTTGRLNSTQGSNLFDVLENRAAAGGVANVCAAFKFAFDPTKAKIHSGINHLTTKVLLMVYSVTMKRSIVLNEKNAQIVFNELQSKSATIASNKGGAEFLKAVSEIEAEISGLFSELNEIEADLKNKAENLHSHNSRLTRDARIK